MSSLATFRVTLEPLEEACIMRAAGEIDMDTANGLRSQLAATRAAKLTTLLDLSRVTFIDSSGLHVLLDAARLVNSEWAFFIVRPSSVVLQLLEVSGTRELLPLVHPEGDEPRQSPVLLRARHVA